MLDINFSLNLQDIERDLKQIRVQNMKESKILEQNCKAKVINILSCGVILKGSLGEGVPTLQSGLPIGFSSLLFYGIALFCDV